MKRNRSDSSSWCSPEDAPIEEERAASSTPYTKMVTFLNHDVMTEVARFVGVFGRDSSCFALVNQKWYEALISMFCEWREYQGGFGLPRSVWILESSSSDSTFNYRTAVVESLKRAAEDDRSRVLMEPEKYVGNSNDLPNNGTTAGGLPADQQSPIVFARTGHLRSIKHSALWSPVLNFLSKQVKVAFLLALLPVACDSETSANAAVMCTLGDFFLASCYSLTTVDLAALSSLTTIGDCFLVECSSLTAIDLAGLRSVTTIGRNFLFNCTLLTTVDLTGLSSLTTIGRHFLSDCTSLDTVDMAGLSSVTAIDDWFLADCPRLVTVDLSGLSSVTTIGRHFLSECTSLDTVDLAGSSSFTTIGGCFLAGCRLLVTVDLASLNSVTTIGDWFLADCPRLVTVDLSGLSSVETLGDCFLVRCRSLVTVDLGGLSSVTTIGRRFLSDCTSLDTIDLAGLSSVTTVGEYFLSGCPLADPIKLAKSKMLEQIKNR